ncbi:MAG: murein biosynthesis integral membrane protein MurJ [Bryobacterales bacterium]|nr:murein biosynthesis integral membrane protein MurJ [Bryobacterales bacterium]
MPDSESGHAQVVRKAGVVSLAVFLSRITGLVREITFAGLFGAGMVYDAFVAAYRIPNLLRDLLAEGALSSAFVTTYSQALSEEGAKQANSLSNRLATLLVPAVAVVCVAGAVFAPSIVQRLFPGYLEIEGKFELTVLLTRIMMPFLLFVVLAAKAMGVLNSHGKFGIPALASTLSNLTSVGIGLLLGFVLGPELGFEPIVGMALGTLLGGAVQYGCQVPSLRLTGLRFRLDVALRDPGVRQVLRLMGPATIGAAAVQINVMVNSVFASRLADASGEIINGPVSWLGYAFRFMQLPLGLFGVAVAAATLPVISRDAGAGRIDEFRDTLSRSLGLVFLLTIPSTVGLLVLSQPLIGVVYERGRFAASDTEQTALALAFYCLGLVGYASTKVLAPAFYALDNVRIPMMVSLFSIALNYTLNFVYIEVLGWGHWALALSTSLVATLNSILLFAFMRSQIGGVQGRRLLRGGIKISSASAVMGACCWICARFVEAALGPGTFVGRLAALLVTVPVGVGLIYWLCGLLRVPELELARSAIMARLARRAKPSG